MEFVELTFFLVSFIVVVLTALYFTKGFTRFKMQGVGQKNMQIIEALPIAFNQYLYIVRIGEDYHLLSGTKEKLNYCTKLDDINIKLQEKKNG
ncbi:MAG: hypothetical protein ATN33_08100 [Epulopiscium sp. Nele67-Bin001]|nr:MAG: hypothetical protein BEN18_01585 [Epulopiscium sp. Nuni2H_MBin001]OON92013.1 MAG: hypothetical protein ATN33_08100 [Epulopiscium sp. Nele67-Bin001]